MSANHVRQLLRIADALVAAGEHRAAEAVQAQAESEIEKTVEPKDIDSMIRRAAGRGIPVDGSDIDSMIRRAAGYGEETDDNDN